MKIKIALCPLIAAGLILTGCTASVPVDSSSESIALKNFEAPPDGKSGIFVYRDDTWIGSALYKDIYIDGMCLGETAPGVFLYAEVDGDREHIIATESEFSPNQLTVRTESGKNYFFEQYIKFGIFVGGAGIRQVDEVAGKEHVRENSMAVPGTCSNI